MCNNNIVIMLLTLGACEARDEGLRYSVGEFCLLHHNLENDRGKSENNDRNENQPVLFENGRLTFHKKLYFLRKRRVYLVLCTRIPCCYWPLLLAYTIQIDIPDICQGANRDRNFICHCT